MPASAGPVTCTVATLGVLGGVLRKTVLLPPPAAVEEAESRTVAPAKKGPSQSLALRLEGNRLWSPARAAAGRGRCAKPKSQRQKRRGAAAKEPFDNRSGDPIPALKELSVGLLQPDFPKKKLGTSGDISNTGSAPGIATLNLLTDRLVDVRLPLQSAVQAGSALLAKADRGLEGFARRAGVNPEDLPPYSGAFLGVAVFADFVVALPLLAFGCWRRLRPAAAEQPEALQDAQQFEAAPGPAECVCFAENTDPALEKLLSLNKEGEKLARSREELVKKLPSPVRRVSRGPGSPPDFASLGSGWGQPQVSWEAATSPRLLEPDLKLQASSPEADEEASKEEKALEAPEAEEETGLQEEQAAAQESQPEEPEEVEEVVAEAQQSTVVRRDASDLQEVMRRRRESCEAWESAPLTCGADIVTQKVEEEPEPVAEEPAVEEKKPVSSPVVRRGRSDLMDLMRARKERCQEFESAPEMPEADVLQAASNGTNAMAGAATAPRRASMDAAPRGGPRRSNTDLSEVMKRRRDSCHEFLLQQSSPALSPPAKAPAAATENEENALPAVPPLPCSPAQALESSPLRATKLALLPSTPERPEEEEAELEGRQAATSEQAEEPKTAASPDARPLLFTPQRAAEGEAAVNGAAAECIVEELETEAVDSPQLGKEPAVASPETRPLLFTPERAEQQEVDDGATASPEVVQTEQSGELEEALRQEEEARLELAEALALKEEAANEEEEPRGALPLERIPEEDSEKQPEELPSRRPSHAEAPAAAPADAEEGDAAGSEPTLSEPTQSEATQSEPTESEDEAEMSRAVIGAPGRFAALAEDSESEEEEHEQRGSSPSQATQEGSLVREVALEVEDSETQSEAGSQASAVVACGGVLPEEDSSEADSAVLARREAVLVSVTDDEDEPDSLEV